MPTFSCAKESGINIFDLHFHCTIYNNNQFSFFSQAPHSSLLGLSLGRPVMVVVLTMMIVVVAVVVVGVMVVRVVVR